MMMSWEPWTHARTHSLYPSLHFICVSINLTNHSFSLTLSTAGIFPYLIGHKLRSPKASISLSLPLSLSSSDNKGIKGGPEGHPRS
jgi:hypothetical protein